MKDIKVEFTVTTDKSVGDILHTLGEFLKDRATGTEVKSVKTEVVRLIITADDHTEFDPQKWMADHKVMLCSDRTMPSYSPLVRSDADAKVVYKGSLVDKIKEVVDEEIKKKEERE